MGKSLDILLLLESSDEWKAVDMAVPSPCPPDVDPVAVRICGLVDRALGVLEMDTTTEARCAAFGGLYA